MKATATAPEERDLFAGTAPGEGDDGRPMVGSAGITEEGEPVFVPGGYFPNMAALREASEYRTTMGVYSGGSRRRTIRRLRRSQQQQLKKRSRRSRRQQKQQQQKQRNRR